MICLELWFQSLQKAFHCQVSEEFLSNEPYPTKPHYVKPFLSVMTFNVAGIYQDTDIKRLSSLFQPHDIVFLQEMNCPFDAVLQEKHAEDTREQFVKLVTKLGFIIQQSSKVVAKGTHDSGYGLEYPTVLYKPTSAALIPYGSISPFLRQEADWKMQLRYCPYVFKFNAIHATKYFAFICISVHLTPSSVSPNAVLLRRHELIHIVMSDAVKDEENVLILADFNFAEKSEIEDSLVTLNEIRRRANHKDNDKKPLPVFWSLNDGSICTNVLKNQAYNYVFSIIVQCAQFEADDLTSLTKEKYPYEDFKTIYSDHLPYHFKMPLP